MFSFPPLIESDQQTGNWYQALLDHPQCQGDPAKIQEAYESYRQASLKSSIASVSSWDSQSATAKIAPSPVLVQYLSQVAAKAVNTDPVVQPEHPETTYQTENVNCMVIWARPSAKVVNLALDLQSKVRAAVGTDMWFPEPSRLHLSVLEISHRHSMAHLRSVYQQMGASLVQEMLDYPATLASAKEPRAAHLGKPMLLFDSVGVAVSFVPVGKHPYTYHHLRTDLYGMALRSAVKIDTCYTACTGHITLGRFISTKTFNLESKEATQKRFEAWVDTIQSINQELRESYWTPEWSWVIGEEKGLEMQIGMLKFGRATEEAEVVGRNFSN